MIKTACKNCGKRIEAPDEAAGKKGRCPGCGEIFDVPVKIKPGNFPDFKNVNEGERRVEREMPPENPPHEKKTPPGGEIKLVDLGGLYDFTFRKFVTPSIIRLHYILYIIFSALVSAGIFVLIMRSEIVFLERWITVLIAAVCASLSVFFLSLFFRLLCEFNMVLFSIKENTDRICAFLKETGNAD